MLSLNLPDLFLNIYSLNYLLPILLLIQNELMILPWLFYIDEICLLSEAIKLSLLLGIFKARMFFEVLCILVKLLKDSLAYLSDFHLVHVFLLIILLVELIRIFPIFHQLLKNGAEIIFL